MLLPWASAAGQPAVLLVVHVVAGQPGTEVEGVVSPPGVGLPVVVDQLLPLLESFDGGNDAEVGEDEGHDHAQRKHGHQGFLEGYVGSHG